MKILAIETSCDETGIALVDGQKTDSGFSFSVLKNILLSQAQLHAEYGGVYPNLAKREHQKNLPVLFSEFENESYDAIAVTQGPGLEPALWTGIEFAKKLATEKNLPLLPTNHMEGHLISSLIKHSGILQNTRISEGVLSDIKLPVLGLLISGGHTEFVLMKDWFKYEIVGETLDDAVGEAFDKVARMLGLAYPGGPEVSKLAKRAREEGITRQAKLPRPMLQADTCDVSFSGLKTAALYALRDRGGIQTLSGEQVADFAREFEDAVAEILLKKTARAMEQTGAKTFVIGGGVAANSHLRAQLQALIEKDFSYAEFRLPELSITGDNAIMIAEAALTRALSGLDDATKEDFRAIGNLSIETK
ncbi:MAG TPA: tRNA (adenosine(37)-N6)-threonylcarbamoyltransferase complex transferase subunit TsaD [Candidatus Paceibacterota bacterium]|nr:tRNA (adenosine(37)-N6)-threonylcarbamoyltransferase complex transferase subunit TsaD [Candidatus Paceibacterota bacterium]